MTADFMHARVPRDPEAIPSKARPIALLVASSLNLAGQVAEQQGWQQIAMHRYAGPDGHEVHAVADRSSGFLGRPMGTRLYLHHSWSRRDDWRKVQELMDVGKLVRHALPVLPKRR